MTKIEETVKDWKNFIFLCITVILITGYFFISKIFTFFSFIKGKGVKHLNIHSQK